MSHNNDKLGDYEGGKIPGINPDTSNLGYQINRRQGMCHDFRMKVVKKLYFWLHKDNIRG